MYTKRMMRRAHRCTTSEMLGVWRLYFKDIAPYLSDELIEFMKLNCPYVCTHGGCVLCALPEFREWYRRAKKQGLEHRPLVGNDW